MSSSSSRPPAAGFAKIGLQGARPCQFDGDLGDSLQLGVRSAVVNVWAVHEAARAAIETMLHKICDAVTATAVNATLTGGVARLGSVLLTRSVVLQT